VLVCDAASEPAPHPHLRALLDDGRELRYDDARRFGRILLGPRTTLEDTRVLPVLGVEPLSDDFTSARLDRVLRSTTRTVKAALLDQRGGTSRVTLLCCGPGQVIHGTTYQMRIVEPAGQDQALFGVARICLHATDDLHLSSLR